jgi:hypothetical protein
MGEIIDGLIRDASIFAAEIAAAPETRSKQEALTRELAFSRFLDLVSNLTVEPGRYFVDDMGLDNTGYRPVLLGVVPGQGPATRVLLARLSVQRTAKEIKKMSSTILILHCKSATYLRILLAVIRMFQKEAQVGYSG